MVSACQKSPSILTGMSSPENQLFSEARAERAAQFYLRRLKSQLDDLKVRTYPGGENGVPKLLCLIAGLLETAEERIKSAQSGSDQSEVRRLVRDALELARLAYNDMELMRGADISELEHSVVRPMQRWFNTIEPKRTVFFRAENVVNYEIRPIDQRQYQGIRDPSGNLADAIAQIDWPLTRVTVPGRALGILPHFSVVAHEFGHAIYEDFRQKISAVFSDRLDLLKPVYRSYSDALQTRIGRDLADPEIRSLTGTIVENWTQEIACDVIAFCLTGPASFFALSDILQFASANFLFNTTHPPKILRRRFLFDLMCQDDASFSNVMIKFTDGTINEDFNSVLMPGLPDADMLFGEFNKRGLKLELSAVLSELPSIILQLGPLICEAVVHEFCEDARKTPLLYTVSRFKEDLKTHLSALLSAIPPIETGAKLFDRSPTEFATILNVGWMALLCKIGDFEIDTSDVPDHLTNGAKAEALHNLLLKAVELSEIRRQWENV